MVARHRVDGPLVLTRDYPRPPVDLRTRKMLAEMGRPLPCDEVPAEPAAAAEAGSGEGEGKA